MAQLNLHVTPEFEAALQQYMRVRGFRQKSAAIRQAIQEAAAATAPQPESVTSLRGMAGKRENRRPRFSDHSDVWR